MDYYEFYKKAMESRRPGMALSEDAFWNYVQNAEAFYYKNSALFGQIERGVFIASHFCPHSTREGVELIKNARKTAIIFAVTEDLVDMLTRLGYKKIGTKIACFRGEDTKKVILVSSRFLIVKAIIKDFINNCFYKIANKIKKARFEKVNISDADLYGED